MATEEEIEQVRLLIPDLGYPPHFTNTQIETFLGLNDDDVYLAAADALEILATDLTMQGGASTIKTDDLTISDKAGIDGLLARARSLRDQSALNDGDGFQVVYPYDDNYCVPEATARPWF